MKILIFSNLKRYWKIKIKKNLGFPFRKTKIINIKIIRYKGKISVSKKDNLNTAGLSIRNDNYNFKLKDGTLGPSVIDISTLYGETGQFTYDPGFTSTASCESKITYIDGEEGILLYRGFPIDELAEKSNFVETAFLLLNGELPTKENTTNSSLL